MTEDHGPLTTSELNIFFDERGVVGMGGGLHIKLIIPGTPTVETIKALVHRVHEYGAEGVDSLEQAAGVTQPPQAVRDDAAPQQPAQASTEAPVCTLKGVWAAAKGRWPEGFRKDWNHNPPRYRDDGTMYCPTPVGKGEDGKLVWCGWGAQQDPRSGEWRTWEAPEP